MFLLCNLSDCVVSLPSISPKTLTIDFSWAAQGSWFNFQNFIFRDSRKAFPFVHYLLFFFVSYVVVLLFPPSCSPWSNDFPPLYDWALLLSVDREELCSRAFGC